MSHNFEFTFSLTIHRVTLDLPLTDPEVLKIFQQDSHRVTELIFTPVKEGTRIQGKVASVADNATFGFMYMDYHIPEVLIKLLALHKDVDNYELTEPVMELTNRAELKAAGVTEFYLMKSYSLAEIVKPQAVIAPERFTRSIEILTRLSAEERMDDVLFFMHLSNTVSPSDKTYAFHDIMNKFRLSWSAFNALYRTATDVQGDKASVIEYSKIEAVTGFLNSVHCRDYLEILKSANLVSGNTRVSAELETALTNKDDKAVAKNALLCIYAVRNANFHGDIDETADYCRVGYELLQSLIKYYLEAVSELDKKGAD